MSRFALAGAALASALFVTSASATVIGNLNIGTGGTATVTLSSLLFNPDPSSTPPGAPWTGEVATGTTLSFVGGPLTVTEAISMNGGNPITAASIPLTSFLTFAAHPNLVFSLANIGPGSANTNCALVTTVGQSCSVFAGSPVILTLGANNTSSATFGVNGQASDTGVGGLPTGSSYIGSFSNPLTTALPNGLAPTPANIQAYFCPSGTCTAADLTSGRSITSPYGGQFTVSAVPEPAAMGLTGLGLLCASYLLRRKSRKG